MITLVLILYFMFSCENAPQQNEPKKQVDVLLYNGSIYTVNENMPWSEAMAIQDGIIIALGKSDSLRSIYSATREINLEKKFVMPGIHDTHIHALESASNNNHFVLDEEENNPENYYDIIYSASKKYPSVTWLRGSGHSLHTLLNSGRQPKQILDDIVSDRPIIIMEQTSHSMWVNSKALEIAGITKESQNPIGGIIVRDKNTNEPNGVLIDNAGNMVMDIAMSPTNESLENDYNGLVDWMLPELAKHGITSISEGRTYWKRKHHEVWEKLNRNDQLTVRVNLGLWAYPNMNDEAQIKKLKSLYSNDHSSLLRMNQIKFYSDGIVHNTTAAMHSEYFVNLFEQRTNNGLNYFTETRLSYYLRELEPTGFDFHIHAIGNRAITESLNAIEESSTGTGRHRLTHVEIVNKEDLPRFNQLNVTADCQVAGEFTQPQFWKENDYLVGSEHTKAFVPLKNLYKANARITLSSDYSVSPYNPFIGLQNTVLREPQSLELSEAIKAYTLHGAYTMRQEDRVGSFEVGKEADLIVLDQHLFDIPRDQIKHTKVLLTMLQGSIIYNQLF